MLVAGPDFGTGSSREHAVWALMDYGFRVVISSRFGDIFRGNSAKGGLLAAQVAQPDVELLWKLLENQPGTELTVDLREKTVQAADLTVPFDIDDYTRWRLLEGLDDIGLTLRHADDITDFEAPPAAPTDHDRLIAGEADAPRIWSAGRVSVAANGSRAGGAAAPRSTVCAHEQVPARGRAGRPPRRPAHRGHRRRRPAADRRRHGPVR